MNNNNNNKEVAEFIEKLREYSYEGIKLVSASSGMLIASICYVDVIGAYEEDENQDKIYLVVDSASSESVSIDYKAIRYIKETKGNIGTLEVGV